MHRNAYMLYNALAKLHASFLFRKYFRGIFLNNTKRINKICDTIQSMEVFLFKRIQYVSLLYKSQKAREISYIHNFSSGQILEFPTY